MTFSSRCLASFHYGTETPSSLGGFGWYWSLLCSLPWEFYAQIFLFIDQCGLFVRRIS
jgi:hypothetical protein